MGVLSKPAGKPGAPKAVSASSMKSRSNYKHGKGGGGKSRIKPFKSNSPSASSMQVESGTQSASNSPKVSSSQKSPKR